MKYSLALISLFFLSVSSFADDAKYTYEVIKESSIPGIKHSIDISLNKKISKDELASLAQKLKGSAQYERTFIGYVINMSEVKNGYWATTHFNPDLNVKILGLTIEQEREMESERELGEGKEIVSRWVDDRPYIGAKITVYQEDEKFYMMSLYGDKSSSVEEIKITKHKNGRKVEALESNGFGEYFLINKKGALEFWSSTSNYYTAKEIK
ncbi:hypothetical protein [uncultured Paraglaciecola sp.]|mgnify:CR=1 FL=1|uniref:hypothetical protein n=1 Tax=uncultured Paraglaciecola sp. TaxID=1765024 RepID=UPI00261A9C7D|nr:hypothetical protein [uncultured Paraglaciecola sp.]